MTSKLHWGGEQGATPWAELESRLTITVPEAGSMLGLGRDAAYAAAKRGEIPTLRFGKRLVVPVPRLLALLEAPATPAADDPEAAA